MSRLRSNVYLISDNEHALNSLKRVKQELKEITEDRNKYKQIFEETASLLINNRTKLYSPQELLKFWDEIRIKYSK